MEGGDGSVDVSMVSRDPKPTLESCWGGGWIIGSLAHPQEGYRCIWDGGGFAVCCRREQFYE
jgi:hypothetical protein